MSPLTQAQQDAIQHLKNDGSLETVNHELKSDFVVVIEALKLDYERNLPFLDPSLKSNRDFAFALLELKNGIPIEWLSDEIKDDDEFARRAVQISELNLTDLPERFSKNKEFVLWAIREHNSEIFGLDPVFFDDIEIAKAYIYSRELSDLDVFHFFSKKIRCDENVIRYLFECKISEATGILNCDLFDSEDFVRDIVDRYKEQISITRDYLHPTIFYYCKIIDNAPIEFDRRYWKPYHAILACEYFDDYVLDELPEDLWFGDQKKEIFLEAVRRSGKVLQFRDINILFKNLDEYYLEATKNKQSINSEQLQNHIKEKCGNGESYMKYDRVFLVNILKNNGAFVKYMQGEILEDIEAMAIAYNNTTSAILFIPEHIKTNPRFIELKNR